VVLFNATFHHVDDIGLHLFDASFPLEKLHTEVKVDTRLYDAYSERTSTSNGWNKAPNRGILIYIALEEAV
jgi:hypothetical protein